MAPNPRPVTQRVPLDRVDDLLTRPARGAIAFAGPDGPECVPVLVHAEDGLHIGLDPSQLGTRPLPERVMLLVDDGRYWFELRAAALRGSVGPDLRHGAAPTGAGEDLVWHHFEHDRAAAWDYGQLHEATEP